MKSFPTRLILKAVLAALCLAAGAAGPALGVGRSAPDLSSLRAPDAPGSPVVGLKYFRLTPASPDTVYRLLVIPVRFPEDRDLGLTRAALAERVNGETVGSVRSYWHAATHGRITVETTVAPTVIAAHPRVYYTSEGTDNYGYGTDPDAYPHNAQGLVEEVTAAVADAVDLRRFDNNADGIVDGLLVLHSGPRAPEVISPATSRDLMLAHAFTTSRPVMRRDAIVFPYAIASARDPVGPWVHEMGHLFGLPDEYVSSGLCPGEGVGMWSLMASGSNLGDGEFPSGLDAYCRQLLGFLPVTSEGEWIDLVDGAFVRAFAPGAAAGPEYFLVERQTIAVGDVTHQATLILAVNEAAVDNRSCTRPLVEVRAALCPTGDLCSEFLDDATSPNLRDADDRPTGLALDFVLDTVRVRYRSDAALRLERVRLLPVENGGAWQRIELTVRNLRPDEAVGGFALIYGLPPEHCMTLKVGESLPGEIPPGGTVLDTSYVLAPIPPATTLSDLPQRLAIQFVAAAVGVQPVDTVTVVPVSFGLASGHLDLFTSHRLDTFGADPWTREGYGWLAGPLTRRVNAELLSPYFTVPDRATAAMVHNWNLAALSPDVALDAAQVRVIRQLAPAVDIEPPMGWGYTVERGIGNTMGGLAALSGTSDRTHVFDLSAWAGETVRLSLRVAGDAELQESTWRVFEVSVAAAPEVTGTLHLLDSAEDGPIVEGTLSGAVEWIWLFHGPAWGTPVTRYTAEHDASTIRARLSDLFAGDRSGLARRCEMVWRDGDAYASVALDVDPPAAPRVLLPPGPNPTPRGHGQTWVLGVPESERGGTYRLALFSVDGRRVLERNVRIDEAGLRTISWDGRDFGGREVSPGIYFSAAGAPAAPPRARAWW